MCGGKSNISERVAVKRASRARFRQIDVSKTATRLKMHEKPPFVLKYCPPECAKNRHSMEDDGVKGDIGGLRMYEDPPLVRHSQDGRVARRACRKTGTLRCERTARWTRRKAVPARSCIGSQCALCPCEDLRIQWRIASTTGIVRKIAQAGCAWLQKKAM